MDFSVPILHSSRKQIEYTTDWTLSQLVAQYGLATDDAEIEHSDGHPLGRYIFSERKLYDTTNRELASFSLSAHKSASGEWKVQRGPAKVRGKLVISSLKPLRSGTYQGEVCHLESRWQTANGWLMNRNGNILFCSTRNIPNPVWSWLYTQFT
jgi:hypothetical protein